MQKLISYKANRAHRTRVLANIAYFANVEKVFPKVLVIFYENSIFAEIVWVYGPKPMTETIFS